MLSRKTETMAELEGLTQLGPPGCILQTYTIHNLHPANSTFHVSLNELTGVSHFVILTE